MYRMIDNPFYRVDFYKLEHVKQYPKGISKVFINWTPRYTLVEDQKEVVFAGLQYFLKKVLIDEFTNHFFNVPKEVVISQYKELVRATLGQTEVKTDHIEHLHDLGYLPLAIYAIPEGDSVPLGVPMFVIHNTTPETFWLPNYIETMVSNMLWKCCTSATTAKRFRKLFEKYARESGEIDFSFIDWMGHDFSARGMSGSDDSIMSGIGHLFSFKGTDTVQAIIGANEYYSAPFTCGGSVPATEHSVMCAGGKDGEFETFERLITEVYPKGIVSIVSDTWDLWKVLTDYIPRLKDKILARDGKIVIRPDSGDPVKIVVGDVSGDSINTRFGAMALLAKALGVTNRLINKGGIIYGDAINFDRADKILRGIVAQGLSIYNMVFGIGSFTYEYVTRDNYGFAIKATAIEIDGKIIAIFKQPVTDKAKNSCKGIPLVYKIGKTYEIETTDDPSLLTHCAYRKVFCNGDLLVDHKFEDIRKRVCTQ